MHNKSILGGVHFRFLLPNHKVKFSIQSFNDFSFLLGEEEEDEDEDDEDDEDEGDEDDDDGNI